MKRAIYYSLLAVTAAVFPGACASSGNTALEQAKQEAAAAAAAEKNVAQVEYRVLPTDYENLPQREVEKWSVGFRPYGSESANFLWSDPNVIRSVGDTGDGEKPKEITALYSCCDKDGISILVWGSNAGSERNLAKGGRLDGISLECFFMPGDGDNPEIMNYTHFGASSVKPYHQWNLSWMKQDRKHRNIFPYLRYEVRNGDNYGMVRITIPWYAMWDKLPVFKNKRDNFWRASVIRWASTGGQTWGGNVHQQTQLGYLRMPEFTQEQKTAIMKQALLDLWTAYQGEANKTHVKTANVPNYAETDRYRASIAGLPNSRMNYNEDFGFRRAWLENALKERFALGEKIAGFEAMSPAEQEKFYKMAAPMLANFRYDLEDAYGSYLKTQLMKR